MARMQSRPMASRPQRKLDTVTVVLLILFVIVAIAAAIVGYRLVGNLVRSWTMTPLEGLAEITQPTTQQISAEGTAIPGGTVPLQAPAGPTPQAWDGSSRVTILLIGLDYRDWEAGNVPRSDTLMLVTFDPISKTAGMLSIPRDTWLNIPSPVNKYAKINQAYYFGELLKLPGGGPGMAMKTVQNFLGVPVNYYAQVDFYAFEKFIDSIGGINVTVDEPMKIDPLGEGNSIYLEPGRVHLNGPAALGFARARYTSGGDFDRGSRQMHVILAVRERILRFNMIPTLVARAPEIYKELSDGIKTNMSLDQAVKLGLMVLQQVDLEKIKKGALSPNEYEFAKSPDGQDILIPHPDQIRIVRDQVFTTGGPASPAALTSDEMELVKAENARVSLLNGTTTTGMASQTAEYFKKNNLNITASGNAEKVYNDTYIYIYNGKPYTLSYLAKVMNVTSAHIVNQYNPDAKVDLQVIIGLDWARKNPMGNK